MRRWLLILLFIFVNPLFAERNINIPILCYHNFNPTKPGSMNLTPHRVESQLQWLKSNGFTVIPLQTAVDYLLGKINTLPNKPIVITVDDGWQSAYQYLLPIAKKFNIPITLFIYPETISNGRNAMTWDELIALQKTGLFDIQSHTYWHPNFKHEKKRLSSANYEKFVRTQLIKSKQILEEKLSKKITLLAWPFGIYDPYLEEQAAKAGYVMAFSIDARKANRSFPSMSQPRYMIVEGQSMKTFMAIVNSAQRY